MPLNDLWADIRHLSTPNRRSAPATQHRSRWRCWRRIIKASSNPGDMVLDPFCGCATTLVAAEALGAGVGGD